MVGRMASTRRVVHHPGLLCVLSPNRMQPFHGFIREVIREVVRLAVLAFGYAQRRIILNNRPVGK
jgi:hypothetical protein